MAEIRLRIVGESVIEVGVKRVTPTSPQLFALLLYLGIEANREVPRAELIELLYPTKDPTGDASHRLRQSLYKLKALDAPITISDGTVRLDGRNVSSAVAELVSGGPEVRRARLAQSFEILPHYAPPAHTALSEWVEQLREKLHNALRQYLTRDMDTARRKADWRYLEAIAHRTLELDPLNESAVLGLAEATARTGSKARAVSILDAYRAELGEERANLALPASLLEKRINASRERTPSIRRDPIPLIGRERELESLLSQWHSARGGDAHLLWLTGNKSVGKSRLAEELAASVQLGGSGQVVTFTMSPMDADRPLSLFATLVNRLSSLPGAAGCHPASLQALGTLSGSISIPNSVNPDNTNSTFSDAAVRNAICDLIASVTDEKAILVIIDDAEYLDEASSHFLHVILNRVADKRFLVVLCGIAESSAPKRHASLHLEPLSPANAQTLWQALLSPQETRLPDDLSRKCLDAAAGNPGHMELLAQQATQDPDQFLIPEDIVTLVERRLRQLPAKARYVLEAIVILDDAATPGSVSHLTGLATFDLLAGLNELESGDLIINTASGLRCRSSLITERVRRTSSGAVTSVMEGRAAEYLEGDQSGDRWSPAMAWRIGAHWQRAGEPKRARSYQRACWQHAISVGQPASACTAIKEALAVTTDPEARASLLDDLIGSSQAAGDSREIIAAVADRRGLSFRVHDAPTRVAELAFDADEARWLKEFDPHRQVDSLREHLESPPLNPHRRIRAARMLMICSDLELDPRLANYAIERCERITPENATSRLLHRHVSLIYHTIFGDRDRALQIANELENESRSVERSWYTLTSRRHCIFARQLAAPGLCDYDSLERGYAHALDASMTVVAFGFAAYLTSVLVDDGDIANAQKWLVICEDFARSCSEVDFPADYFGAQVDLSLLRGDWKKAQHYMEVVERCWAHIRSLRVRNALRIYRLRVRQHCGQSRPSATELETLLSFHDVGKCLTRHDDHMEVLWTALNAVGECEHASTLLAEYLLQHRRERGPIHYFLRHRTKQDPIWQVLDTEARASIATMGIPDSHGRDNRSLENGLGY